MTTENRLKKIQEDCRNWIIELSDDEATAEERTRLQTEFQNWIMADTLHAEHFEETQRLWGAIGQMHHLETAVITPIQPTAADKIEEQAFRQTWWKAGMVASFIFAALVIFIGMNLPNSKEFSTEVAEIRDVQLPDQSLVTLGAQSEIEVEFTESKRQVFLKNGDAFFDVQKDPARPFFVAVDGVNVRVVGTKFDIHHGPEQVRISVLEGVVEVTTPKTAERDESSETEKKVTLTLGQQLITDKQDHQVEVKRVDVADLANWRSGWLAYSGVDLRDLVADANRYYDKEIVLESEAIETLKVTASFKASRIDQMLAILQDALPIVVDKHEDGRIVLRSDSSE